MSHEKSNGPEASSKPNRYGFTKVLLENRMGYHKETPVLMRQTKNLAIKTAIEKLEVYTSKRSKLSAGHIFKF